MRMRSAIAMLGLSLVLTWPAAAKTKDEQPWTPGQVLVKFKSGHAPETGKNGVKKASKVFGKFKLKGKPAQHAAARGLDRVYLLELDHDDVEAAVAALSKDKRVEYAEPNWRIAFPAVPNDPSFGTQWGLQKIGAPAAWDSATSGTGLVIGVVDTGIDVTHPDLAANIWVNPGELPGNNLDDDGNGFVDDVNGWNFAADNNNVADTNGHGTRVAGIIGAVGNNATGVSGVVWTAKLAALRIANGSQPDVYAAVQAIEYANMMGFRITSNSWGWWLGGQSFLFDDVVAAAEAAGYLLVVAAGNESKDNDQLPTYPAHYDTTNVISVTATTQTDGLASFGNWGARSVDLGAPGVAIDSTSLGGTYASGDGTSFSTPFVAGAAALYWTANPGATHVQVRDELLYTSQPVPALHGRTVTGGRLSLSNLFDPETTAPAAIADLTVTDATFRSVWVRFTATGDDGTSGNAARYEVRVSTSPITESNFANATPLTGEPLPQAPGTLEAFKLSGLAPATTYYIAVRAYDNAGNGSALSNVATFATTRAAVLFDDNVDGGTRDWTVEGSNGIGGPSLWHVITPYQESPLWSYSYDAGVGYDTGARNWGALVMRELDLSQARDTRLRFRHHVWTDRTYRGEVARVQVSVDGGAWTTLLEKMHTLYEYVEETVDLSPYDGHRIRLRFHIDTVDAYDNDNPGWQIENFVVDATSSNAPPVVNINGPYSATEDAPAALSSAGSSDPDGAALEYKWDFGDGKYAYTTSTSVSHVWTLPGTYTVRLTAFDGRNSAEATTTVSPVPVNDRPVAYIETGFSKPPYYEETSYFFPYYGSSDEESSPLNCRMSWGDGTVTTGPCQPQVGWEHKWMRPGTYTMSLVVNDGELDSLPDTEQITVLENSNDRPVAVITGGPYDRRPGESVTFDGTASSDEETSIASYQWTFGDGTAGSGAQPVKTYSAPGSYNVALVVTDQTGLTSPSAGTQVNVCGGATADMIASWTKYTCPGGTVRLAVSVRNAMLPLELTWSDGYVQQVTSLVNNCCLERTVAVTGPATYSLVSVTDRLGCSGTVGTTSVPVDIASATLDSYEPVTCPGQGMYLAPTLRGDKPWTITWSDGYVQNIPVNGDERRFVTPQTTTTYSIVSAVTASCQPGAQAVVAGSKTIRVISPPVATLSGGGASCGGSQVPLHVNITGGEPPYTVIFSDSPYTMYGANGSFTRYVSPSADTTYTITRITSGSCTGTFSGSATVTVGTTPSAVVSGGGSFCAGSAGVTITAALTGTAPFTVTWSDGVSQTVTGNSVSRQVSPASATTYTITNLTGNGCSGTATGSATATPRPLPTAAVSGGGTYCEGGAATITAALTGTAPFTVTWSDGVVQTVSSGTTASRSVSPTAATTYSVTAVSDAYCTGTASGSATVTRLTRPVISQQPQNATVPRNGSTTITVVTTESGLNYQWYEGPAGTTSKPVGTNSPSFTTPKLRATTQYWVKIWKTGCTAYPTNSTAATITVQ